MSLNRRLRNKIAEMYARSVGATDLAAAPAEVQRDLRSLTGLFEILGRKPPYAAGLQHCVEVTSAMLVGSDPDRLVGDVAAALLADVSDEYRRMGFNGEAAETFGRSVSIRDGTSGQAVLFMMSVLSETDAYAVDPRVVAAVSHALMSELERTPPSIKRASVLAAVAVTTYQSGYFDLLPKVIESAGRGGSSAGLDRLLDRLRPERVSGDPGGLALTTRFANLAQAVAKDDPASKAIAQAARQEAERLRPLVEAGDSSLGRRASEAAERGDFRNAADFYDELANDESMSSEMRAGMTVFALCARLLAGQVTDEVALEEEIIRMVRGRILHARSLVDLQQVFNWLLDQAVAIHGRGGSAMLIAEIFDLAAECRTGAAVRHTLPGETLIDEPSFMSLMTRDAQKIEPASLTSQHPSKTFLWLRVFENQDGFGLLRCYLDGSSKSCRAFRHDLNPTISRVLARSIGDDSFDLSDEDVCLLTGLLFGDLPPGAQEVVVIPDAPTWDIPWSLIVPRTAREVAVIPSAAAFNRLVAPSCSVRTVIGVFDEELSGARQELAKLAELAERGHVELTRAHSYQELSDLLSRRRYDMLTVAVHGTSSDGFEYRMMLPGSMTSPASLFKLALPPVVVLGCCWSARSTETPDAVAATVGCLAAGASVVVGGLWAIDDSVTGRLLSEVYERYFTGQPLGAALRAAYLELPENLRREATGITMIGRG